MKCFSFILFALFFITCKKDDSLWQIENLNGNEVAVYGHGGMGDKHKFPMNSMASLNMALNEGTSGTEMDVQITKDCVLVLYHPKNLEDATNYSGKIKDKNWSEIKGAKYKSVLSRGNEVIRLTDFFDQVIDRDSYIYTFDCKVETTDNEIYLKQFAKALTDLITKYNLESRVHIESYNMNFLRILFSINAKFKLFIHADNLKDALQVADVVNLYGITMDRERISKSEIKKAHDHNLRVALFNLRSKNENIEGIQMNADFLQTDKVEFLVKAIN